MLKAVIGNNPEKLDMQSKHEEVLDSSKKIEALAKKIINMSHESGASIDEFFRALDMAEKILSGEVMKNLTPHVS